MSLYIWACEALGDGHSPLVIVTCTEKSLIHQSRFHQANFTEDSDLMGLFVSFGRSAHSNSRVTIDGCDSLFAMQQIKRQTRSYLGI